MKHCANCDTVATKAVIHPIEDKFFDVNSRTPLCETCAEAYEWGQASPDATIVDIDDGEGKE